MHNFKFVSEMKYCLKDELGEFDLTPSIGC